MGGASPVAAPGGGPSWGDRGAGPTPASTARRARRDAAPGAQRRAGSDKNAGGGNVSGTIREAVKVVPAAVWVALAALLAIALAFGARTLVERRRTRALEREKEELLRDVGLLERALLPAVPERLGALSASAAYRPATGPAAGGDFYDAFELSEGRAAILIGDVSGHGREALVRTRSIRSTLRACLETGMSPRASLESAARALAGVSSGDFATVAVAVHDPASGMLTYATAGHPPPILVGTAAHEPITVTSAVPIGVGIRTGQRQTTVPLLAKSAACFFTDGLLEARKSGELIGRARLTKIVTELDPDEYAEAVIDRVVAEADETPDDMAACLLRALVGSDVPSIRLEELELDGEELGLGIAERFLEVCGVPSHAIASAVDDASRTAAVAGGAVLEVTIDSAGACVNVKAPTPKAEPARLPAAL
jgi:hypothetical protein